MEQIILLAFRQKFCRDHPQSKEIAMIFHEIFHGAEQVNSEWHIYVELPPLGVAPDIVFPRISRSEVHTLSFSLPFWQFFLWMKVTDK